MLIGSFNTSIEVFDNKISNILNKNQNVKSIFEEYLKLRASFKDNTFLKDGIFTINDQTNINNKFNETVDKFSDANDLHDFIIVTSFQDIIAFYKAMINLIKTVKYFIHAELLTNAQEYFIHYRGVYKSDLYLKAKFTLSSFNEIKEKYNEIFLMLDDRKSLKFAEASKYQD
ncbi:11676_t:CDS:2, partial [Racocetra persica]